MRMQAARGVEDPCLARARALTNSSPAPWPMYTNMLACRSACARAPGAGAGAPVLPCMPTASCAGCMDRYAMLPARAMSSRQSAWGWGGRFSAVQCAQHPAGPPCLMPARAITLNLTSAASAGVALQLQTSWSARTAGGWGEAEATSSVLVHSLPACHACPQGTPASRAAG